ncbi:uncharacterized protein [Lolium perenne]|uniref:uncharacterized protein isoform X2 n=1 Tax=Lolium perenne TaxID=4522 RepID=UPI0021F512A3|nr:uncharacterized protein LOC127292704 isoform X2 [Lolium perenne]
MVVAVAAVVEEEEAAAVEVWVREYDGGRDRGGVEEVERECEVGSSGGGSGKMCLFTDLLGDPLCRIRNSPAYLMLLETHASTALIWKGRGDSNRHRNRRRRRWHQDCRPRPRLRQVCRLRHLPWQGPHLHQGRVHPRPPRLPHPPAERGWEEARGADGGVVPAEGRGVLVHGDGAGQRSVRAALHGPLRLLQVPHAVRTRAPGVPPRPRALPPRLHREARASRRRTALPLALRCRGVLPGRHRRRAVQRPVARHVRGGARGDEVGRRRRGVHRVAAGVVGGAERVELHGRLPPRGARSSARDARRRGRDTDGGPRGAVARDPFHPKRVQAVRALLPLRPGRRWARGAEDGARAVPARAQHGTSRRVRCGGHRGRRMRACPYRCAALGAPGRRGPLVHEAARGRVHPRHAR